mmetsp:Transcript_16129/g.32122  ORF Transcript_16129/g.32122 Transcript_16129/m.32122 type:complete len:228 (-) Transcript_16129:1016-1699(-)
MERDCSLLRLLGEVATALGRRPGRLYGFGTAEAAWPDPEVGGRSYEGLLPPTSRWGRDGLTAGLGLLLSRSPMTSRCSSSSSPALKVFIWLLRPPALLMPWREAPLDPPALSKEARRTRVRKRVAVFDSELAASTAVFFSLSSIRWASARRRRRNWSTASAPMRIFSPIVSGLFRTRCSKSCLSILRSVQVLLLTVAVTLQLLPFSTVISMSPRMLPEYTVASCTSL